MWIVIVITIVSIVVLSALLLPATPEKPVSPELEYERIAREKTERQRARDLLDRHELEDKSRTIEVLERGTWHERYTRPHYTKCPGCDSVLKFIPDEAVINRSKNYVYPEIQCPTCATIMPVSNATEDITAAEKIDYCHKALESSPYAIRLPSRYASETMEEWQQRALDEAVYPGHHFPRGKRAEP